MATTLTPFYRALGKTGIQISPLGLGTVKFGRNEKVKYPTAFDLPDEDALAELLALAKSLGINLLDTAPAYGLSEQRLGRLLKGQRADWVIVGKAGESFTDGVSAYDFSPDAIKRQVEQSLKDMQTDYLDVLLMHPNKDYDDLVCEDDTLIKTLVDLRSQGIVKAIGTSAISSWAVMTAALVFDVVMLTYSLNQSFVTQSEPEPEFFLETVFRENCGVLLKKIFNSGHAVHGNEDNVTKTFEFIFANPGVHGAIVGTINPDHLRGNVEKLAHVLLQK